MDDVAVRAPMVPPETVMSSTAKVDDASDSVTVIVSVWLALSAPEPDRVNAMVGEVVSMLTTNAVLDVRVSAKPSMLVVAVERTLYRPGAS